MNRQKVQKNLFEDGEPTQEPNLSSMHTATGHGVESGELPGKWTVFDDINFIISQHNMTSARVQNTFIYLANELRALQIKNLELTNYINEKEGRELAPLPHIPFNEPNITGYDDLIAIHARTAKSLMLRGTLCFFITCLALFLAALANYYF